jgi:hypothetical protein
MLSYKEDIDGKKIKIGDLPCLAARSRFRSTKNTKRVGTLCCR